jgi:hypothetical protein
MAGLGVAKPGGTGGAKGSDFDSLKAQLEAANQSASKVPAPKEKALLGGSPPDDEFGAGVGALGESVTSSIKGIKNKIDKWADEKKKRFEPGGSLYKP